MKYKQLFEADGPFPNFPDTAEGARSPLKRDSIHKHLDKAEINPGPGEPVTGSLRCTTEREPPST